MNQPDAGRYDPLTTALPMEEGEDFRQLGRFVSYALGRFGLALLRVPSRSVGEFAIGLLARTVRAQGAEGVRVDLRGDEADVESPLRDAARGIPEEARPRAYVVVFGLDAVYHAAEGRRQGSGARVLSALSVARQSLVADVPFPLLFVLDDETERALRLAAPDFVRFGIGTFDLAGYAIPVVERMLRSPTHEGRLAAWQGQLAGDQQAGPARSLDPLPSYPGGMTPQVLPSAPPSLAGIALRVLVLLSEPLAFRSGRGIPPISLDEAWDEIERAFQSGDARFVFRMRHGDAQELIRARTDGYNAVVFFGHGTGKELVFEGPDGRAHVVGAQEFSKMAMGGDPARPLRLLVTCACHSQAAIPDWVFEAVDHVVAVEATSTLLVTAGIQYCAGLARALARGLPVQDAHQQGQIEAEAALTQRGMAVAEADAEVKKVQLRGKGDPSARLVEASSGQPVPDVIARAPLSLPHREPPFQGRADERCRVIDALGPSRGARIVTIVGTGGIGKSRLALACARWLWARGRYPGGVCWVEAREVRSPDSLLAAIGEVVGIRGSPDDLMAALGPRKMLLVLDNLDTLFLDRAQAGPARRVLERLLNRCPSLQCIATSREELGIGSLEHPYSIPSLDPSSSRSLFLAVARQRDYAFREEDRFAVQKILSFCDGYPLAIYLLASHLAPLTPRDIADRLKRRGVEAAEKIPAGELPGLGNSVRASLQFSYDLLPSEGLARKIVWTLALFPAGLLAAALDEILGADWKDDLGQTRAMVMCSDNRVDMLTPVRDFVAREVPSVHRDDAFERAAHFYAGLASLVDSKSGGAEGDWPVRRTVLELPNVLVLARWAAADKRDRSPERERAHLAVAHAICALTGPSLLGGEGALMKQGLQLGLTIAARFPYENARADCVCMLGDVHRGLSELPEAKSRYQEALSLYGGIGDRSGKAHCILRLGVVHGLLSELPEAKGRYQEALSLYGDIGDRLGEANCILKLGDVHLGLSELPEAKGRYEEALSLYRAIGDRLGEANCIDSLGDMHLQLSELPEAKGRYQEALSLHRAIGDRLGEANCAKGLGNAHLQLAELPEAKGRYEEALSLYRATGGRLGEANCIQDLADVHLRLSELPKAKGRYEEALSLHRAIGNRLGEANCIMGLGRIASVQGQSTEAMRLLLDARERYRAINARGGEGNALGSLGKHFAETGNHHEAILALEEALVAHRETRGAMGSHVDLIAQGASFLKLGLQSACLAAHYLAAQLRVQFGESGAMTNFQEWLAKLVEPGKLEGLMETLRKDAEALRLEGVKQVRDAKQKDQGAAPVKDSGG